MLVRCFVMQKFLSGFLGTNQVPRFYEIFAISAELSMKFQLLIKVEIVEISGKFSFSTQQLVIYPAHKC